ncbi:intracellular protein transport protein USO1-like [Helianthus annuus]|uniref:intracellular protein transport protein USO1-like n=1 Tax=Helianthus annuus TaxID=4232 RepID=UPI000B9082F7|nr:intracellular protein transport protein USO1-like [Helianthus annuus]
MRDYQMNMLTALVLNKKYNFSHIVFHYMVENLSSDVRVWRYPRFVQMMIDRAYPGIDRNIKDDLLVQAHMSNISLKNLVKYHPHHPEPELVIENFGLLRDANYVDPDPENHQNWRNQEEMKEALYAVELKIIQGFKPTKNEWYVKESGRRRRLATPVAEGEDESEEEVPEVNIEKEQEAASVAHIEINIDLFTSDAYFVDIVDIQQEREKVVEDVEGDDVDKDTTSSSSGSVFEVVDAKERERRMREEVEKEKLLRKRKREEKEDAPYEPSPEHVSASQSTPKGKKKAGGRKKATPKIKVSKRPQKIMQTQSTPPRHQTPPHLFGTPPIAQAQPGSSSRGLAIPHDNLLDVDFDFANNSQLLKLEKRIDEVIAENKKLASECKKIAEREKSLAGKVQRLEGENKVLALKIKVDQTEIDVLKVRVSELEEEKNRRESENEYYKLKNKELMAAKALHEHKFYMLNRVVESMLETTVDQKYEELKLEDLRAERKAEVERQMKDKGKGVEGSSVMSIVPSMVIDNPVPISSVPGIVEEEIPSPKLIGGEEEEDDEDDDEEEFVYSASSHSSKVNEESGEAERKGESSKTQIVEHHEPLFLCLDVYREMLNDVNPENPIDLEADLESFDINKQKDYKYNYVEDADQYDRVEVEDGSDNEDVPEDTSKFPTLMEFFAAENREELRQKVTEAVNEKMFENLKKDTEKESQSNVEKEDHSKWFKDSHERKFKRPLKFFQCDRSISLGDIISWGFLPQVNAYAIRREYGVQYFKRLYDIM